MINYNPIISDLDTIPADIHGNASFTVSSDILEAQNQAEKELENYTNEIDIEHDEKNGNVHEQSAPAMPKLLQLAEGNIKQKTHELKAKGQQLDILLLKAESYSQFIVSNLKASTHQGSNKPSSPSSNSSSSNVEVDVKTPNNKSNKVSKRSSTSSLSSSKKKSKNDDQSMLSPAASFTPTTTTMTATPCTADGKNDSITFTQPPNLIGGKLLPYQLEGLRWLLSLWENGLSGILADEMVSIPSPIIYVSLYIY